ncbi:protein ABCI7, chloroplastic-like [Cucurbita moschata]|uniref:Protein ABCI7, chloroplastic-like n=1 Tax=Cucurbita moschata TaxID=3662 RepID=A0A6J1ES56_CUCMO|nr:protein ABCI7, chloroplastic-like [Cucurbita moschata]
MRFRLWRQPNGPNKKQGPNPMITIGLASLPAAEFELKQATLMAAFTFTPRIGRLPTSSPSIPTSSSKRKLKFNSVTTRVSLQASPPLLSDPFVIQLAETLEDSLPSSSSSSSFSSPFSLQKLRESSAETLLSTPWPSRRDEPFRFTDVSLIKQSQIHPISNPPQSSELSSIPVETQFTNIVIVDGHLVNSISNLTELPNGVYVGSLTDLSSDSVGKRVSEFVDGKFVGDLFWSINGVGAPDLTVVYVPAGCKVENPIHLRYYSISGGEEGSKELAVSNPRVLVLVENGGEIEIIEEFLSGGGGGGRYYWANPVLEVVIGSGGKVKHSYIQNQSLDAAHIKWTSVQQESTSAYELVEISTGGKLSRHNVHIKQLGPETTTELSTLHLSVGNQTQDLHSSLVLDHPRAYSRQLHKCIVANPQGQAVFDGNVKVNRYAQQTDAGQLTRSLLLEPRATVNVKPNLQIIADDVKCSHGAAISDLEETQLFYFQARGIDLETARKALIFSFGAEVIERLPSASVRKRVENHIKDLLNPTLERS